MGPKVVTKLLVVVGPVISMLTVFLVHSCDLECVLASLDDIVVKFVPQRRAASFGPGHLIRGLKYRRYTAPTMA
jgi:hypothetical protein